jgi:RNA recognition motif-containing protein
LVLSIPIGRSRGFGFVTFADSNGVEAAIQQFNNQDFEGRQIKVDRASERAPSSGGSRGGFRGGFNSAPRYNNNNNQGGYGGTFFTLVFSYRFETTLIDTSGASIEQRQLNNDHGQFEHVAGMIRSNNGP